MTAQMPEREGEEMWEMQLPGAVYVEYTNHLGKPADKSVSGKGSILRIATIDRQLAEEKIVDHVANPFRNGTLVYQKGGAAQPERAPDALTDDDLAELFVMRDDEFDAVLEELSQVNVRRMQALAKGQDASISQVAAIDGVISRKWPLGGAMPSYEEMNKGKGDLE